MTAIDAVFLPLLIALVLGFVSFDRLVKLEHNRYRQFWLDDGRPDGFFWHPGESTWFSSGVAKQVLLFKWLFSTPGWASQDGDARKALKKLRACVLIWNVGIVLWIIMKAVIGQMH